MKLGTEGGEQEACTTQNDKTLQISLGNFSRADMPSHGHYGAVHVYILAREAPVYVVAYIAYKKLADSGLLPVQLL
jgi:hypothetical protein